MRYSVKHYTLLPRRYVIGTNVKIMPTLLAKHRKTASRELSTLSTDTKQFIHHARAPSTRKAYVQDAQVFVQWCQQQQRVSLPATPETVADFLSAQAQQGCANATLRRRVAAIRFFHTSANFESPTQSELVSSTLKGIRRTIGAAQEKKAALTVDKMYQVLAQCNTKTLTGKRDKALLLLGFAGALRRSELVALDWSDLEFVPEGLRITIRQSKTDQEQQGQTIAIPNGRLNVATVLQDWLYHAAITEGAVFRSINKVGRVGKRLSDKTVYNVVKHYTAKAGLDPNLFGAHSLRSGFITTAAENGANLFKIMDVSRHKSVQTVQGYVRYAELFKDHAGSSFL